MFFGFIKSIFFHVSVIFSLFLFANFINFNNNQIYTEIPIEIVEVSEETNVKKTSKKKIEEKKQTFVPPQPKSKPKPPEFSEKKIVKSKVKKKQEIKEDRLSKILMSIENISKNNKKIDLEDKKETKNVVSKISSEKVTISEKDLIRRQFASCWNPPSGSKNIDKLQVLIKLTLDEEGIVLDSKLIGGGDMNDPFYRSAAERAMRAVRHPSCKKVKVPSKKYDSWKNMTLNFDPIIMQGLKK